MHIAPLHSWEMTPKEAVALQRELAGRIETRTPLTAWNLVAGADVSYDRFSPIIYAAVVVLRASDWSVVEVQSTVTKTRFPYVPGLLSFRESPILLDLFAQLKTRPDVLMCDGHGYAHPRRFGYACHVGLWLDIPTMGCAKSILVGKHRAPGRRRGAVAPLRDGGEVIGMAVRTRDGVQPVYASVGHRIDLPSAVRLILESGQGYRIPEPTRQAHLHVNLLRRAARAAPLADAQAK
jgi:deoxyribonuclease V